VGLYHATLYVYDGLLFSVAEVTVRIHESTAPDLTGEWSDARLHCPPQRARGKCHLLASLTITNKGIEDAAASRAHVFLSDDPIRGPEDTLMQSFGIGRLTTSSLSERTISASLLRQQVVGKYLIAVVDASEAITETDEANNTLVLGPLQATIFSTSL
jgi:hypothetical protein